jgi:anthranilate 1,2-dioxygenase (deaminating, decarboxylating) large subunit
MGEGGPRFVQRVEFTAILPTGRYDKTAAVSPGSNFFSFDPYWSGTLWLTPKLTSSVRFHYLWNAKNDEPAAGFGPASDTQAGQALHANATLEYAVLPQLRIGANGYWFQQITDTKVNGDSVEGRKEKVWAVGPGAIYSFSKDNHLFFNAYFEQAVRNRPEGDRFVLRYVHHF